MICVKSKHMGSVRVELSPCEKMGSDEILSLLMAMSAMFSLRIYPTANGLYLFLVRPKIGLTTGTWYHTYMYTYIHYSMAYMYVRALLLRTHMCLCIPISYSLLIGVYHGMYVHIYIPYFVLDIRGFIYV